MDIQKGSAPITVQRKVPTYPKFRLDSLEDVVSGLELTPFSFIDYYDGKWKTINITTVIDIDHEAPTLFKLRPNLRTELSDCDFPGLAEEVRLQPKRRSGKRRAEELVSPPTKLPRTSSTDSLVTGARPKTPILQPRPIPRSLPVLSPSPDLPDVFLDSKSLTAVAPLANDEHKGLGNAPIIDTSTSLHERRWPRDFFACELDSGFSQLKEMSDESLKSAFPKVFKVRYVKTTYQKYRNVWQRASSDVKTKYVSMGRSPSAQLTASLVTELKRSSLVAELKRSTAQMCPYCDEPLSGDLSPGLLDALDALYSKSQPAPTFANPGHRKTAAVDMFSFCDRHRFELEELPQAQVHGWSPNFASLHDRVKRLRPQLQSLLDSISDCNAREDVSSMNSFFKTAKTNYIPEAGGSDGSRNQWSMFNEDANTG